MILAFLATRAGKFAAIALAVVLVVAAFMWWLDSQKDAAVRADRAQANAEAAVTTRKADEAAHGAAQGKSDAIQEGTDRAKDAAAQSDDPLAAGLRSLRAEKGSTRDPTR